jgi:iron complex outermembrane recepter protein
MNPPLDIIYLINNACFSTSDVDLNHQIAIAMLMMSKLQSVRVINHRCVAVACLLTLILSQPALGQTATDPERESSNDRPEIIVTAPRISGTAIDDIAPEITINEDEIEGYGASTLADLLSALAPQTQSGRGRDGGAPIILVNGRRISGFAEIRDLPSEAILRVEVLPEEAALRYGFSADQRVTNFILRPGFAAITFESDYGLSIAGGRGETELGSTFTKIGKKGRINLNAEYNGAAALTEDERNIARGALDPGQFRTLLPRSDELTIGATVNRTVTDTVGLTLNARYDYADRASQFGVAALGAGGVVDPLDRDATTRTLHGGLTLDGPIGRWQWSLTGNVDRARFKTLTDRQSGGRDSANSTATSGDAIYTLSGALFEVPAGKVQATLRGGFDTRSFVSQSVRGGVTRNARFGRDEANVRASLDIPLADREAGVASALGDLSINFNAGYRELDDFAGLTAYGFGLNWEPVKGVSLLTSITVEDAAPSIQQLGEPLLVTPGVPVFDFRNQASVIIDRISGGNPGLQAEQRRDVKIGLSYQISQTPLLSLSANFFRNRSSGTVAGFPALTPEIERAFPSRFIRDASGRLLSIDTRPINYDTTRSDILRTGFNLFNPFKAPPRAAGAAERPAGIPSGGIRPGGGPGRGGGFGRPGGPGGIQLGLYYSYRVTDEISIQRTLPALDLLDGSAVGGNGGSSRHAVELESGVFRNGLGLRLTGNYISGSTVKGSLTPGSSDGDLRFSDLLTLNARLFINFDSRKSLIKRVPILRGTRLALRIDNLTNAIRDVRDTNGMVPFSFLPGFVDPRGRFVEVSLRKIF